MQAGPISSNALELYLKALTVYILDRFMKKCMPITKKFKKSCFMDTRAKILNIFGSYKQRNYGWSLGASDSSIAL